MKYYGSEWITKLRLKGTDTKLPSSLTEVVSVEELLDEFHNPLFSSMNKVLLAMVVYYKKINHASPSPKGYYSRLAQNVTNDGKDNERVMTVMCLNSKPGVNTAIIPLSNGDIDKYFMSYLIGRDDPGGFGPGAILAIVKPKKITNTWGDKYGLPVLSFGRSFGLIDAEASRFKLTRTIPFAPNDVGNRLHSFFFPKVTLTVTNFNPLYTTCTGYFCDSVCMIDPSNGRVRSFCPCVQSFRMLGGIVLELEFYVEVVGEFRKLTFSSDRFTSRTFTDILTRNGVPLGITCEALNKIEAKLYEKIREFFEFVNTSGGGFSVLGWVRVGRSKDSEFSSSTATYHITKIVPNCDPVELKPYVMDISAMLKDEEENLNDDEAEEDVFVAEEDNVEVAEEDNVEVAEEDNVEVAEEQYVAENIAGSSITEELSNMTRGEGDYARSVFEERDQAATVMKDTEKEAKGHVVMTDSAAMDRNEKQLHADSIDEHIGEVATKRAKITA